MTIIADVHVPARQSGIHATEYYDIAHEQAGLLADQLYQIAEKGTK